ncbi:transcriptional regulator, HxlR family [Flavobacteriaceae bacterium 3519-10]|nr:transcriptional regulator, HxlR family [Flavobacteriaceae bacterium 3519-10]
MTKKATTHEECKTHMRAVHDALYVLNGKWKIPIVTTLFFHDKRRFSDILNDVEGISNKMLSKELKELEINKFLKRTVLDTQPVTVEYELTEYGRKLEPVIINLSEFGIEHRKRL